MQKQDISYGETVCNKQCKIFACFTLYFFASNEMEYQEVGCSLFYSILSHNLGRSSGHHRWIRNNPFPSWPVFSCPSWAGKVIPVHSLILSSHLFFCLPLFLFPFTVPWRIVFAKPEDLETWPNHLSFRFLTRVRSSSYSPMAAWIFLRTSSLVTWSLYEMFNSLR